MDIEAPATGWQRLLTSGPRTPVELLAQLGLAAELVPAILRDRAFPMRVPPGFVERMQAGDPDDPLLRQVLPIAAEQQYVAGFVADPVGDLAALRPPGLIHKYAGRALVMTTGACAIHCRYCFRRHFPYADETPHGDGWHQTVAAIAADPSLEEIILSGGDPLMLPDGRLSALTHAIAVIPHVRRIRLHTRLPVVLPERIDEAFLAWFAALPCERIVVIHANHPHEIDANVAAALARLRTAGACLLNQSVLLRGVNDDARTLARLSQALFSAGVLPYYLHLLDRVAGAAHFELSEPDAVAIQRELMTRLPGYLVPRLVREVPGQPAKQPVPLAGAETRG